MRSVREMRSSNELPKGNPSLAPGFMCMSPQLGSRGITRSIFPSPVLNVFPLSKAAFPGAGRDTGPCLWVLAGHPCCDPKAWLQGCPCLVGLEFWGDLWCAGHKALGVGCVWGVDHVFCTNLYPHQGICERTQNVPGNYRCSRCSPGWGVGCQNVANKCPKLSFPPQSGFLGGQEQYAHPSGAEMVLFYPKASTRNDCS